LHPLASTALLQGHSLRSFSNEDQGSTNTTSSPRAAIWATSSATPPGNATVADPSDPKLSLSGGLITTPETPSPLGRTTRIVAPANAVCGSAIGTDHQPAGMEMEGLSTDRVIGSPCAMSVEAVALLRSGTTNILSGAAFQSMASLDSRLPRSRSVAANGYCAVWRPDRSQAKAASTIAAAANHRRNGGLESHNTCRTYRDAVSKGRGLTVAQRWVRRTDGGRAGPGVTYNPGVPLVLVIAAYLLGSVNSGVLVARSRGVDIYSEGSGNPGTSNVMRVLGKRLAVVVLLGDGAKGAVAAAIGALLVDPAFGYVTLLAAVVGHAVPVWHRFRGGKSVATAIGGLLYLAPLVGVVLAGIWIVSLVVWKTASIGSLVAMALMVPLLAITGRRGSELVWSAAIAILVTVRHAGNIKLLLRGSERKVS